jgi:hypothetical protein
VRGENRREKMAYVFDLRFDLDVWVHAEGKVLDRPTHARITRCRFTPRGRLFRHPSLLTGILQRRRCTFSSLKKTQHVRRTNNDCYFHFHLASGPDWWQKPRSKEATYRLFDQLTCHPSALVVPQLKMAMRPELYSLGSRSR